ncbi:EAL domain-containing protein [Oceanospirillum linum]|nr:EAL domain-containing protein [Oceanospirillum linum]SEG45560.1 PAS domain S-box-containing protein/diguanylate cyclase (GGDEF) domain-containing protein [Oleiphilus messinensis]SMP34625.1 diguanylate cyclase/phosphodiesterase with PAS/PAC sensor(s) [Oceanospirillum linum]
MVFELKQKPHKVTLTDRRMMFTTDVPVRDVIHHSLLSCCTDATLHDAALQMNKHHVSSILVMDAGEPVGIWTEADARKLDFTDQSLGEKPISGYMSSPVDTVDGDESLSEIALKFQRLRRRHFLVTDQEHGPIGVVSQTDVIRSQGLEHYLCMRNVRSALNQAPLVLDESLSLADAVNRLRESQRDAAAVRRSTPENYSIITERDIVQWLAAGVTARTLKEVCSNELYAVDEDTGLLQASNLLKKKGFRHLGVVNQRGGLIGILSYGDILDSVEYEYVNRLQEALQSRDEALKASTAHLRLAQRVIEASLDGIIITDKHGIIESVNPKFTQVTGYSEVEAIGQSTKLLSSGRHSEDFYRHLWSELQSNGYWQGEIWNRRKNGQVYPEWLTITAIYNDEGDVAQFAAIFSDITDRKKDEERIRRLAFFDDLTGVANRRLFQDRLEQAIANAHRHQHRLAVLFLDLDMFKRINDSLGHVVGDEVLKVVAGRLAHTVREGDSVARLGGDEFTVMVPEVDTMDGLMMLAQRINDAISEPISIGSHELYISTSIGISIYPDDGMTSEDLIKNADAAMYRVKADGRGSFHRYTDSLHYDSVRELTIETRLRKAIKDQAFQVKYQPKIELKSGRLIGFEALLRWHDKVSGLVVSPVEFIPVAERLGLIGTLGEWVLEAVCRDLLYWHECGYEIVPVAVNISVQQLMKGDLATTVRRIVRNTGVQASWLELEVTESCFIPEQADRIADILHALRMQGVNISIDDFGTGYSSLSYLRRLPLDALKIDRTFVTDVAHNADDARLASTIIAMAKGMGLKVVAEGIENKEQLSFLQRHGCHEGQGFMFAKAEPAKQVSQWLSEHWNPFEALDLQGGN